MKQAQRSRGRATRAARFLAIVVATAAVAVTAFVLIYNRAHRTDVDPNAVEADVQLGLQSQLTETEPEADPQIRSVDCIRRADGPNLRCLVKLTEYDQPVSVAVNVTVGSNGEALWEVER